MQLGSLDHRDLPQPKEWVVGALRSVPCTGGASRSHTTADDPIDVSAALKEDVGLDFDTRKLVLDLYMRLGEMNDHEVLGVPIGTDSDSLRHAYFAWSKRVHPDAHRGIELGAYRRRMERVFARITDAYGALSRPVCRVRLATKRITRRSLGPHVLPLSLPPTRRDRH